jgi:hypothetical protein
MYNPLWREDGFFPYDYALSLSSVRVAHIPHHWKFFLQHYTLCKFFVIPGFAKQITSILLILCYNGSLVIWTVVSLTTLGVFSLNDLYITSARTTYKALLLTMSSDVVEAVTYKLTTPCYVFTQPLPCNGQWFGKYFTILHTEFHATDINYENMLEEWKKMI